jgi:hypothetical protein
MSLSSLNFLQELRSLELELSTLMELSDRPDECEELFAQIIPQVRGRLNVLVNYALRSAQIAEKIQMTQGEGESAQTANGLPVLSEMLVEALINLILRVMVNGCGNLAFKRDLLANLHAQIKVQDSSERLPSLTEKLTRLLDSVDQMEQAFVADHLAQRKAATDQNELVSQAEEASVNVTTEPTLAAQQPAASPVKDNG